MNDELDLLEYRLRILGDVVDEFFVIESPLTFTGQPKPLFVSDARERFAPWKDKLILHVVEIPTDASAAWRREHAQHRPKRHKTRIRGRGSGSGSRSPSP